MPKSGDGVDVSVYFKIDGDKEIWNRKFADSMFISSQIKKEGLLYEKLGPVTLVFDIPVNDEKLSLDLKKIYFLGIPIPKIFFPKLIAEETEQNGKFNFNVEVEFPIIGLLVKYKGWLQKVGDH